MRDFTGPRYRARHVGGAILAIVAAISLGGMVSSRAEPVRVIPAVAAPAPAPASAPKKASAQEILSKQAAALNRGDLGGWLAPVAPALRQRYQNLFRTLRALDATVDYRAGEGGDVLLTYCFAGPRCPADAPRIAQRPLIKNGQITALGKPAKPTALQPAPWEQGDLVFARGRRVTVGAPKALKNRLKEVVALADQAAAVDDRFAAYAGNRQPRYRVFLATDKLWRTWYGGKATTWAVGYMQPLGPAGADVVINPRRLTSRTALKEVIQHELGHVATIGGVSTRHEDMWLVEGVAEYVGMQPSRADDTYSKGALRRITRLNPPPLRDGAGEKEVSAFYAQGHFAVDCLVTKFGEARAMEFVRLRLRLGNSLDMASRSVFGMPFRKVDATCVDWISNLVVTRR
ncbi:hypothetical protein ACQPZX_04365 [Actinoplanes sp. CA-142083]|uniref:hypothetical protein n=1 Tax=Actinoplanes sp. CA-142083 TaxID=3239903 RepID=UPI003D8B7809